MDIRLLESMPLFTLMSPEPLLELAGRFVPRAYERGAMIFHQGDPGSSLHIINSGRVKISISSDRGDDLVLAVLGVQEFFGELALIDSQPRSASAMALEDTQTYTLEQREFFPFLIQNPQAAIALSVVLAARLRRTDERLAESVFLDLPRRLAVQLLQIVDPDRAPEPHKDGEITITLTQRDLAEMIGASRQRVNQTLGLWEAQRLLRRERGRIFLRDVPRLRRMLSI